MALYKDKNKIHFRHNKRNKHNALIVGEDKKNFDYIKVTHNPRKDRTHKNNKFFVNPKKTDKKDSFYENKVRIDIRDNFDNRIKSWVISKKDLKEVEKLLNKKNSH